MSGSDSREPSGKAGPRVAEAQAAIRPRKAVPHGHRVQAVVVVVLGLFSIVMAIVFAFALTWLGVDLEPTVLTYTIPLVIVALVVLVWSFRVTALILAACAVSVHLARCWEYASTADWSSLKYDDEREFLAYMSSKPGWLWVVGATVAVVAYLVFAAATLGVPRWPPSVWLAAVLLIASINVFWVAAYAGASSSSLSTPWTMLVPTVYILAAATAAHRPRPASTTTLPTTLASSSTPPRTSNRVT